MIKNILIEINTNEELSELINSEELHDILLTSSLNLIIKASLAADIQKIAFFSHSNDDSFTTDKGDFKFSETVYFYHTINILNISSNPFSNNPFLIKAYFKDLPHLIKKTKEINSLLSINTIVFDMDGLMFDTEALGYRIWKELLIKHNLQPNDNYLYGIRGKNANSCRHLFNECYPNSPISYDDLKVQKNNNLKDYLIKNEIPLKKGIKELLNFLKYNNYKMVVASSSEATVVKYYLEKTNLISFFEGIISGDMVTYSKPNKEIFCKALAKVNSANTEVLVLEDSLAGILASNNANIKAILIPDNIYIKESFTESFLNCNSLFDIMEILNNEH